MISADDQYIPDTAEDRDDKVHIHTSLQVLETVDKPL